MCMSALRDPGKCPARNLQFCKLSDQIVLSVRGLVGMMKLRPGWAVTKEIVQPRTNKVSSE